MAGNNRSKRGFAGMDPEKQREIARRGGLARSRNRQSEGRDNSNSGEMSMNDAF